MSEKQLKKELEKRNLERQLESLEANKNRAQSITVGTSGGGTVEIMMRTARGNFMWNVYQPVEIIELINQMAAGIGCHIHVMPRQDFASWRDWKVSPEELEQARGFQRLQGEGNPPFAKMSSLEDYRVNGKNMPENAQTLSGSAPKEKLAKKES